jgi:hypothetical protein
VDLDEFGDKLDVDTGGTLIDIFDVVHSNQPKSVRSSVTDSAR